MTNAYHNVLSELKRVNTLAKEIVKTLEYKNIANCKVLGNRLLNYQISEIEKQVKKNFKAMEDFFYQSYKGFYCSICDYENHKFFKEDKSTVVFSEKFCRDIVEHSLPTLLFFHVHINKYANLVSKFLLSCDIKGNFSYDMKIPKDVIFVDDDLVKKNLVDCRTERNTHNWFVYCKNVCTNFKINTFDSYFEGNLDKIEKYAEFIQHQLKVIRHGGKGISVIDEIKQEAQSRILSAVGKHKKAKKTKRSKRKHRKGKKNRKLYDPIHVDAVHEKNKTKKEGHSVFNESLNPAVRLEYWKSDFQVDGVSLYD